MAPRAVFNHSGVQRLGGSLNISRVTAGALIVVAVLAVLMGVQWRGATEQSADVCAEEDWNNGVAGLCAPSEELNVEGVSVLFHVDRDTGLFHRRRGSDPVFCDAYNSRVRDLMRLNGVPRWSVKADIPALSVVVQLLQTAELPEVHQFPHHVSQDVVLLWGGSVTFGTSTYSTVADALSIASAKGGLTVTGSAAKKVFAEARGNTVIIRSGREWLGIFHKDGRRMVTAYQFPRNAHAQAADAEQSLAAESR